MSAARRWRLRSVGFALLAGVMLSTSGPLRAQSDNDAFEDGIKARNRKQWSEVVTHMNRAIQADAKESTRKVGRTLGLGGTEYLPHYFLGEAWLKQNNCVAAIRSWSESERQGVIQTRTEYYAELKKGSAECEAKGFLFATRYDARMRGSRQQLTAVNERATQARRIGDSHRETWMASPKITEQYNAAIEEYRKGEALLKDAAATHQEATFKEVDAAVEAANTLLGTLETELKRSIAGADRVRTLDSEVRGIIADGQQLGAQLEAKDGQLTPQQKADRNEGQKKLRDATDQLAARTEASAVLARTSANEGHALLKKVLDALNDVAAGERKQKADEVGRYAREAFSRVDAELATIASLQEKNPDRVTAQIVTQLAELQKRLQTARRRLGVAVSSVQPASIEAQTKQAEEILTQLVTLSSAISPRELTLEDRGVPLWLQAGARLYLEGNYSGALASLDDGQAGGPAELHVQLFQAASQHALYVRSGETDASLRDRALAAINRCKAIDATFVPDSGVFSPRFIEFYRRGAEPAPTASRTP